MYEFTIIVPVYDEEENLTRVERELLAYTKIASKKTSILFVNDGSKDKSQQLIEEICHRNEAFHFICFDKNYGLSTALKAGFDFAESPLLGYIDSDLQTIPADFNLLLEYVGEYDLVTGIRINRKDGFAKSISSKIANAVRRAFTQDRVADTGCPLKVIKAEYAKRIPMFKGSHRFLPALVLLQNGSVKQVPVRHFTRTAGATKFGILNRVWGSLVDCFVFLWIKRKYINYEIKNKG